KKDEIDRIHSLENYLFFMVKNRLINDRAKKERVKKHCACIMEQFTESTPDDIGFREIERDYKAAVSELSPRTRQTYLLKNQGQLKIQAIAKEMNISQSVVKQHLGNAQKRIREKMKLFCAD
ncbi:MAG TPA: sigma factor-like helix-turn-helix DNA-binding protein, partial [Puia sp.]|nr:sigma factor-like helix-turn-helix DNA-binding protein [Puia sp.]